MLSSLARSLVFSTVVLVVFVVGFSLGHDVSTSEYVLTGDAFSDLPEQGDFSGSANIVAVSEDEDIGIVGRVTVNFVPGDGDILLNIRPFIEPDTQYSAQVALEAAQRHTSTDISNKDVLVSFHIPDSIGLVGGPSAGAPTAVAMVAAIENKTVKQDVALTGTIDFEGNIGYVGGILKKVEAAEHQGVDLFLIPEGESVIVVYEERKTESRVPFFERFEYLPRITTIQEYADEQGWSIEVKEVATLEHALEDMLEV